MAARMFIRFAWLFAGLFARSGGDSLAATHLANSPANSHECGNSQGASHPANYLSWGNSQGVSHHANNHARDPDFGCLDLQDCAFCEKVNSNARSGAQRIDDFPVAKKSSM